MDKNLSNLQNKINLKFKNINLLKRAITHKSHDPINNYEKLEFLGDNRDCSKDSRYLSEVGYVHKNNIVGKARILFFSSDYRIGSILKFWQWPQILRFNRFFKKIN